MSRLFTQRVRVRYYECDPQGAVWNANFLNYLDVAHTELMREARGAYGDLAEAGIEVVMAEARICFLAPARFDDELDIDLSLRRLGTTALTIGMVVRRDRSELAEAEARYVYVDSTSGQKTPIPKDMRLALAPYLSEPRRKTE